MRKPPSRALHWITACALVACGGDPNQRDGGTTGGGATSTPTTCDFLAPTPAAAAPVAAAPVALATHRGPAQNLVVLEQSDPLAPPALSFAGRLECPTAGALVRAAGTEGSLALQYVSLASGAAMPELIDERASAMHDAALFFDSGCSPVVLRTGASEGPLVEYTRAEAGWTRAVVGAELATLLGTARPALVWLGVDATERTMHVFVSARSGESSQLLHGARARTPGAAWTFRVLPSVRQGGGGLVFRADAQGAVHVAFRDTQTPCDPCDVGLYYAVLRAGSSAWARETLHAGVWGMPGDELNDAPSMALTSDGNPLVAAHFQRRVATGSFTSTELRVYGRARSGSTFCHEVIARESDDYAGGDGSVFTGAAPSIAFDARGRLHVAFLDLTVWHDRDGLANEIEGNLRYAVRAGDRWQLRTLLSQPGQRAMPLPLHGFGAPTLRINDAGTEALVLGSERVWQTGSIYNTDEPQASWRSLAIRLTFSAAM